MSKAFVDPYVDDLGDDHADLRSHDAFVRSVPHGTFARLRREDPVSWWELAINRQQIWFLPDGR